jgi:molybdopterin-containing oxidoreductase family membrane subunit
MATVALPTKKPSLITPGFLAWLAFLLLCLGIGLVSAYEVLTKGLGVTNMNNTVPWGLWITIDLSAIALGAGAFTLSAIVYLLRLKRFEPIVRLAVYVGFVGYTTALLTLVMDIGRPDRFWHPWVYWNVHSVLWEITWCITLYLVILGAEFLPVIADLPFFKRWSWFHKLAHGIHKIAPVLAVIGMGISLLHQSSLGATYGILRSRPIWFKPSMPIMFILSAVAVGPALTMAIAHITEWATKRPTVPHEVLRAVARFCGFGLLAYLYIKVWDLMAVTYYGRSPQVNQGFAMLNDQTPYGFGFFVVEIGLGIIIPAIFFLSARFNRQPVYLVVGALCAVLGIIANRWNVTVSGLTVPLSYSPGVLYQSPAGVYSPSLAEWGVAIGVIGYALLMLTLGLRFLPLFNGTHGEAAKS